MGPKEIRFSIRARMAAGAVLVVFLTIFLLQLAAIDHQRRIAKSQGESVEQLLDRTRAAESALRPTLEEARRIGPPLERAGRAAATTISAADPLVRGLVAADAPGAVRRGDALAVRTMQLFDELARLEVAPALTRLDLLPRLVELQERSVSLQADSLSVQRETLAILGRSLAVQEETLVHARSLDRKTGGPLPPG